MATLTIRQADKVSCLEFTGATPLHTLLEAAGYSGARPCGGRGVCGKCTVELTGSVSAPNEAEQTAGVRLACQAVVLGDAEVRLPQTGHMEQIQSDSTAVAAVSSRHAT